MYKRQILVTTKSAKSEKISVAVNAYYSTRKITRLPEPVSYTHLVPEEENEIKLLPWWKSVLYIIGGLAALIYGGQLFVNGATGIARNLRCV